MKVYFEPRDLWVGYYRSDDYHYICVIPTLVLRWRRKISADMEDLGLLIAEATIITAASAYNDDSIPDLNDKEVSMKYEASTGADLIMSERLRQIHQKRFDGIRDDEYTHEELAMAAIGYAMPRSLYTHPRPSSFWPWPDNSWKPGNRIDDLKKAGALLAAEIDRLLRLKEEK